MNKPCTQIIKCYDYSNWMLSKSYFMARYSRSQPYPLDTELHLFIGPWPQIKTLECEECLKAEFPVWMLCGEKTRPHPLYVNQPYRLDLITGYQTAPNVSGYQLAERHEDWAGRILCSAPICLCLLYAKSGHAHVSTCNVSIHQAWLFIWARNVWSLCLSGDQSTR